MKSGPKKGEPSLRAEWQRWYRNKAAVLKFVVKFGGLIALLYIVLAIPFFDHLLYYSLRASAWTANTLLPVLGQPTHLSGTVIQSSRFAMKIERGCDALEPTWMVVAAMLAFPATWAARLTGIGLVVVLMQLMNLLRVITLFLIGVNFQSVFNPMHLEIWPAAFIIVEVVAFVYWKEWAEDRNYAHAPS